MELKEKSPELFNREEFSNIFVTGVLDDWKTATNRIMIVGEEAAWRETSEWGDDIESEVDNSQDWVFPATRGSGHFIGLLKVFNKICQIPTNYKKEHSEEEKKPFISKNICLHSLRHSFASIGADMNYNELTIAGLLGDKLGGVTNRYSHNVDASLIYAADTISKKIAEALEVK